MKYLLAVLEEPTRLYSPVAAVLPGECQFGDMLYIVEQYALSGVGTEEHCCTAKFAT